MTKKILTKELENLRTNRARLQREIADLEADAQRRRAHKEEARTAHVEALALVEIGEGSTALATETKQTLDEVQAAEQPTEALAAKRNALALIGQRIREAEQSLKVILRGEDEAEHARVKMELTERLEEAQALAKDLRALDSKLRWTTQISDDTLIRQAKVLGQLTGRPYGDFM